MEQIHEIFDYGIDFERIKILIRERFPMDKINDKWWLSYILQCVFLHKEWPKITNFLIDNGLDINYMHKDYSVLGVAFDCQNVQIMKFLIEKSTKLHFVTRINISNVIITKKRFSCLFYLEIKGYLDKEKQKLSYNVIDTLENWKNIYYISLALLGIAKRTKNKIIDINLWKKISRIVWNERKSYVYNDTCGGI